MSDLFINGVSVINDVAGLDDLKVKVRYNSDKSFEIGISSKIKFRGAAFDAVNEHFITNNANDTLEVDLKIDCCDDVFRFEVINDDLGLKCVAEEIEARMRFKNPNNEAYNRVKERIFWSNIDGSLPLSRLVGTLLPIWIPIGANDFTDFRSPKIVREQNRDFLGGIFNGWRYIPSTLVVDILDYAVRSCGLDGWESSFIVREPYNRLCIVGPTANKAPKERIPYYIPDFMPNLTFAQVLETVSPMFRADYRFQDNKIIWEPISDLETPTEIIFNIDEAYSNGRITEEPTFILNNDSDTFYAMHRFEYETDSLDGEAKEVEADYNWVVIFDNDGSNDNLKGETTTRIPYHLINFDGKRSEPGFTNHRNGPKPKIYIYNSQDESLNYLSFREDREHGLYNRFYKDFGPETQYASRWTIDKITHLPEDFCSVVQKLMSVERYKGGISSKFGSFIFDEATINFKDQSITYEKLKSVP